LAFVFDVSPDRSSACVSVAGRRDDGLGHVEVMEHKRGTGWLVDWLVDRAATHQPAVILYEEKSPAASLVTELEEKGVTVEPVNSSELAKACGNFYDAVEDRTVRHLGTNELVTAIRGVAKRPLGEAWAWSRKTSTTDITPLVSCTLALWGLDNRITAREPMAAWA
jgi:hypothetical protein